MLLRQLADAGVDERRLHRGTSRRIDRQRHGGDALAGEGALQQRLDILEVQARPERRSHADGALQAKMRHHRR